MVFALTVDLIALLFIVVLMEIVLLIAWMLGGVVIGFG